MSDEHAPQPEAQGLAEPLRSRWSPSVFDDQHELNDGQVELLLHAAQWAPSFGNTQPWSYLVLRRGTAAHAAFAATLSRGNAGWVPRASVVLLGATQIATSPDGRDVKSVDFAYYDAGQAAAHVTLQARAMGLHAHQFAGFDHDEAARALGVPDHLQLMAGIAVGVRGRPDDVPERDREREERPRTRRPLEAFVADGYWGRWWGQGA